MTCSAAVGSTEPLIVRPAPVPLPVAIQRPPLALDQFMAFTAQFEGRRLSGYRDSRGRYTIGVGHRCSSSKTLTNAQVDALLARDTSAALAGAQVLVPHFDQLPDSVQLIVVDMVYNLGRTGFCSFTEFRGAIARHDWLTAARALRDSGWYRQVTARGAVHVQTLESLCPSRPW